MNKKLVVINKNTQEADEQKYAALRNAIKEGIASDVATDFDPEKLLLLLKGNRVRIVCIHFQM